jgi:hypothetical protein
MGCASSKDGTNKFPLPQVRSKEQQDHDAGAIAKVREDYEYFYPPQQPLCPHIKSVPVKEIPVAYLKDFIQIFFRIEAGEKLYRINEWHNTHPGEGPFSRFDAIFEGHLLFPKPKIMDDWQTDAAFTRARVDGLYPWFLTKADLAAHDFPVTDALLGDLIKGHTLSELSEAGRLFTLSLPMLEGLEHRDGAVVAAPIELHWVNDEGVTVPIAIQLRQKSSESPIFTPNDPANVWLAAKIHAGCAITHVHTVYIHAVEMHWVSEAIWLGCVRNVAADHPVRAFMAPHYDVLFFVNEQFRAQFEPDGAFKYLQTTKTGHWQLMSNGYKDFNFENFNIPKFYAKRGLDKLKTAYFRDDSLKLWDAHSKLCRAVVDGFYATDKDVADDFQVQAWMHEISDPSGVNMRGLPLDSDRGMKTKEQLIELLSCMFFDVTVKHSFLEAAKMDYFGYAPFNPDTFRLPIPQTKDEIDIQAIVDALPNTAEAVHAAALMHNGSTAPDDFKLDLLPKHYMEGAPKPVTDAVAAWMADLKTVEEAIKSRNTSAGVNYTYCLPSVSANQIHN